MLEIDPIKFNGFDRDTSKLKKVPVYNSKTDFSQKTDIFTKSKKSITNNPKKYLLGMVALIGGAIATGLLIKKCKPIMINFRGNRLLRKSEKIIKQANFIAEEADIEYMRAYKMLQNSKLKKHEYILGSSEMFSKKSRDYEDVFVTLENGMVMVVRKSMMPEKPDSINIAAIYRGFKGDDETYRANEIFEYSNGILKNYFQGFTKRDGRQSAKSVFSFRDGKLFEFKKGMRISGEKSKTKQSFIFIDNKLRRYYENINIGKYNSKTDKTFYFDANGKVTEYYKGTSLNYDRKNNVLDRTFEDSYLLNKDN